MPYGLGLVPRLIPRPVRPSKGRNRAIGTQNCAAAGRGLTSPWPQT